MVALRFADALDAVKNISEYEIYGVVVGIKGLLVECEGIASFVTIGSKCIITNKKEEEIVSEVIAVDNDRVTVLLYRGMEDIGVNCQVRVGARRNEIFPDMSWKGRVINALGEPIDAKGVLRQGSKPYLLKTDAIPAHDRRVIGEVLDLGIRSLNTFTTCCKGQRMGIFAGSGVGKSVLLSMMTKYCAADIKVIGLIGERGREVQEFLQEYLGEEGLKNAVVVVATGDENPLMRKQAAYTTITVAEYFRDLGLEVLCLMDSVTRFAMAQREIGLSVGEPPTQKGYTPTVFAELPKLLERAGPGSKDSGNITGIFSVLVEGGDTDEPISDAVRGILDGHIVLDRAIAERGRFPAVNILRSLSRLMYKCVAAETLELVRKAKNMLSIYSDMEDMIRLGAYKHGSNKEVDEAIMYYDKLEKFLSQEVSEKISFDDGYEMLRVIMEGK